MKRQEQFGAFIEAAQKQRETNSAAETMSDLIPRILSKSASKEKKAAGLADRRTTTSPLPYAGKPKRNSGRRSS
jgi:hypothetical protein